ncbi:MAG: hypothetical protein ABWZ14_06775, partial [Acidimicrobiales bacterium]
MLDDVTLARLAHLNYLEFGRQSSLWSDRGEVRDGAGVALFASGTDFPFVFNGVFRTDPAADPGQVLGRADAFFDQWSRGYTLVTGPGDDDLVAHAEAEGLWAFADAPEMVCRDRLADVDPP